MLPPVAESVLQSNPKFAALHAKLSAEILNPNGSTKNHPAQKERDAVAAKLESARIEATKSRILIDSLASIDLSPPEPSTKPRNRSSQLQPASQNTLPPEVIELIILLTAQLSLPLSHKSTTLLQSTPQYHALSTHLPQISTLLSTHLHHTVLHLTRILNPTINPSYLHRRIPLLLPTTISLQTSIPSKFHSLSLSRTHLTNTTTHLLSTYHTLHTLIIQLLERQKHGPLLRHSVTKISNLSLTAQGLALELKERYLKGEKIIYDERTREALGNYLREVRGARERLRERGRTMERELWGYGVGREDGGKEKVMREIARVYGELRREMEEVGRDVERLKGR